MSFKEIFDFQVSPGKIALVWFNSYSGIIIKTPISTLIFDPVRIKLEECIQADVIAITHEHFDHFDPELVRGLQKKTNAPVLTSPFVAQRLPSDKVKSLRVGDSFRIKDVKLHAEYCDHPANQPLSFVISTESGITIYHPNDSNPFGGMAKLRERFKPDILLYFGTSLEKASQIARLVRPQVILSYYTDMESRRRFTDKVEREVPGTNATIIKRFEIYQYPN
ncbi:hypothetical protein ES702_06138 [subsurface metagenome]